MWYFVHEIYIAICHLLLVLWSRLVLLGSLVVEADLSAVKWVDMLLFRVILLLSLGGPFDDLLLLITWESETALSGWYKLWRNLASSTAHRRVGTGRCRDREAWGNDLVCLAWASWWSLILAWCSQESIRLCTILHNVLRLSGPRVGSLRAQSNTAIGEVCSLLHARASSTLWLLWAHDGGVPGQIDILCSLLLMLQVDHVSRSEVHVVNVSIRDVGRRDNFLAWELVTLEDHLGLGHAAGAGLELLMLLHGGCVSMSVLAACLWLLPYSIYLRQLLLIGKLHL